MDPRVDSATADRSIPRPRIGPFRDRGSVHSATGDRGAVDKNSRGSRGGERSEPTRDPRNRQPPRTDRGAVALHCERDASQSVRMSITASLPGASPSTATTRRARCRLRRTSLLGLTMRPLRGRCVTAGDSAGHARTRCARPRDPRLFHRPLRGRGIDRSAVADSFRCVTAPAGASS